MKTLLGIVILIALVALWGGGQGMSGKQVFDAVMVIALVFVLVGGRSM